MIITLCGSAHFEKEFKDWNLRLTMAGHTVFSLTAYPSDHGYKKTWYTDEQKRRLDEAHKRKIDASQTIFVINQDDYVGDSTKSEIAYARKTNKAVIWAYRYNGPSDLQLLQDSFPTCPHVGCLNDFLSIKPPCPMCYE